jgi:hypothetical protein
MSLKHAWRWDKAEGLRSVSFAGSQHGSASETASATPSEGVPTAQYDDRANN